MPEGRRVPGEDGEMQDTELRMGKQAGPAGAFPHCKHPRAAEGPGCPGEVLGRAAGRAGAARG